MSTTRKPMMAGNWKMNLTHVEAIALVQQLGYTLKPEQCERTEVVLLPSFTSIRSVQTTVEADKLPFAYGAQDISVHDEGAYTGEVSGLMLAKLGCRYAVIGHSERRQYAGESDELIHDKVVAAYRHGITPILCVGEGLPVREAREHVDYTLAQLAKAVEKLPADQARSLVIAYEPVWAIGTGVVASPDDAQEMAAALRGWLASAYSDEDAAAMRILYGGSVKPSNVAGTMSQPDVDGALVGGASLTVDDFAALVTYEQQS